MQRTHHPFGHLVARWFRRRTTALRQHGACNQTLAEPARKVHFAHRLPKSPEDSGCHCCRECGDRLVSAVGNENEQQWASRALCATPLDG